MTAQPTRFRRQTPTVSGLSPVRIGCSGWQYAHWRGNFYPDDAPKGRWLEHYAEAFDTVEVNNSFYRLPEAATFRSWRSRVKPGFVFAVKASRFLTHLKKLNDPEEPIERFFARAEALGPALGPVLYQLPPRWPLTPSSFARLEHLVRILPPRHQHAVEFRDPSWYAPDVLRLLDRHGLTLCLHDMPGSATGRDAVGSFTYVRFHGTSRYAGSYGDAALAEWADWLAARARAGVPVFVYFNNDTGGHAPRDARRLRMALGKVLSHGPHAARARVTG
jgi:uncharacterized protein YecE (DUF72 family)